MEIEEMEKWVREEMETLRNCINVEIKKNENIYTVEIPIVACGCEQPQSWQMYVTVLGLACEPAIHVSMFKEQKFVETLEFVNSNIVIRLMEYFVKKGLFMHLT